MERSFENQCCLFECLVSFLEVDYTISVVNIEGGGLTAIATRKDCATVQFTCSFNGSELAAASIDKSIPGCKRLIESLALNNKQSCKHENQPTSIESMNNFELRSSLKQMNSYKTNITHQEAVQYLSTAPSKLTKCSADTTSTKSSATHQLFLEVVADGLAELCRAQPTSDQAIKWLGNWLLEKSASQPIVQNACYVKADWFICATFRWKKQLWFGNYEIRISIF